MDADHIHTLAVLRAVVGCLGERDQASWWQSGFYSPESNAFLGPVFPRTQALAQCMGVSRAAAMLHDERIGVGRAYHLFRLPEDLEQRIHAALHEPELGVAIAAAGEPDTVLILNGGFLVPKPRDSHKRSVAVTWRPFLPWCTANQWHNSLQLLSAMTESINHSRIIDFGNGDRSITTPGWEWGTDDVAAVLQTHGQSAAHEISSPLVQHAFDVCVANERRIQKAVLAYADMEDQIDAYMAVLEDILVECGVLKGDITYFSGP